MESNLDHHPDRGIWPFALGVFIWAIIFVLCLGVGSTASINAEIIWQLRFPRIVMATAIGMGLSVSGALLQALFTNPLCEPYTLGVSSGASLGAVLGAWIGLPLIFGGLTGSAFCGALLFSFVLYLISLRASSTRSSLLLAGVMLGFLGSSLVALVMAFSDPNGIQGALFWILGDLSRSRLEGSLFSLALVLILSFISMMQWRSLDALLLGEETALSLGVNVARARSLILVLASLLIGVCVSGAGMIGFVGLVVPHFSRRIVGSMHRKLLPFAAISGAITLVIADALTRGLARPYELPVGVVTAFMGAPVFLWIFIAPENLGMKPKIFTAENLKFSYQGTREGQPKVLDDISLEIRPGDFTALLGPNGCGKSTLLKVLAGLINLGGGRIRLGGEDFPAKPPAFRARAVAYLGCDFRVDFPVTVFEAVLLGRTAAGTGFTHSISAQDQEAMKWAMKSSLCWEWRGRDLQTLSGGERQLVGVARALAQDSKIMLLDESLSQMDLHHQAEICKMLRELTRKKERSVILVSHDVNLASEWADQAILLKAGKIIAEGPMKDALTSANLSALYPGAELVIGANPVTGTPKVFFSAC